MNTRRALTPPRWWRRPGLHGCFGASSDTLGYRPLANAAEVSAAAAALIAASPTTPVARDFAVTVLLSRSV
ncbi:hypothetical protein BN9982_900009 [Mycobacterium tuberculosis]|nr:hypothetical protein BN9982_900009 [Mycobacterium tuberculosis]